MTTGLMLIPRTPIDANEIAQQLEAQCFHAEWDVKNGYFFFPEEEYAYDDLEKEIVEALQSLDLQFRIEGRS